MYQFNSKIRYSELDETGKLSIENIVNYFQDASNFQAQDLGLDFDYYMSRDLAWVLSFWQIVFEENVGLGDAIEIGTYPHDFKSFMGFRNFYIKSKDGAYIAKANSVWTLLDMKKIRPAIPEKEILEKYPTSEKLEMNYASRKVSIPTGGELMPPLTIRKADLDTNLHVNNAKFISLALEHIDTKLELEEVRAEYKKQAYLGDVLLPYRVRTEDGYGVSLLDQEGQSYFNMRLIERKK